MKRLVGLTIVGLLLITVLLSPVGSSMATAGTQPATPSAVIESEINATNAQAWDQIPSFWTAQEQPNLAAFLDSRRNQADGIGYFDITSARLVELKELPFDAAQMFSDVNAQVAQYRSAKVFYVGIDYKVRHESKYYFNGVNYRLITVVPEDGQWKIARKTDVPVDSLVGMGLGLQSHAEKQAVNIYAARRTGQFVNATGQPLEDVRGTSVTPMAPVNDHARPATVTVRLTKTENQQYYGCYPLTCNKPVDFYYYVKNVLPNEWGPSWPIESLKAGAESVKAYGWYASYYPLHNDVGADVYDTTADQVFTVNTEAASTTNAINAVGSIMIEKANSHGLFLGFHRAGDCVSGYHGGKVWQNGTKCLGDSGKTYDFMLHYYYDNSLTTNGEPMGFFSY